MPSAVPGAGAVRPGGGGRPGCCCVDPLAICVGSARLLWKVPRAYWPETVRVYHAAVCRFEDQHGSQRTNIKGSVGRRPFGTVPGQNLFPSLFPLRRLWLKGHKRPVTRWIGSGNLTFSTGARVRSPALRTGTGKPPREQSLPTFSHRSEGGANLVVGTVSQKIHGSNHRVVQSHGILCQLYLIKAGVKSHRKKCFILKPRLLQCSVSVKENV